jgi:predicted RNA-binding Zn-ribbon protein involved in translation (DUF1610 family)
MMETPASSSNSVHRRRAKRHRRNRFVARIQGVWRNWWVEILVALLALLAMFLLVERIDIRDGLLGWFASLLNGLEGLITVVFRDLLSFVQQTTLSDLVAYLLLLAVAIVLAWRLRWRLMHTPRLSELTCPRCGSDLHRIHRRTVDRALNLFVPVRRYQCKNHDCGWRGLKVTEQHHG